MLQPLVNQFLQMTQPQMSPAVIPVQTRTATGSQKRYNPFMNAQNPDSQEYHDMYGINRPLDKPVFLGYRDNQALYGGSRLFILY